jgi:arylformamidase
MSAASDSVLYRGMTRAELDGAYSPSSMVASIDPFLRRYADDSAAARASHDPARFATHGYGAAPEQTLDLFLPASTSQGLLIFIHGGYWQALNASDVSFPAPALTRAGFAYAAINYTLAPHATMDAIVEENRQALAWLWNNRGRLGIDAGPLLLAGHSAGAHLAAMMLTTDWAARGIDPAFVSSALLLGGVYDLEPIRLTYVNDAVRLDLAAEKRNSPAFGTRTVACPLVVTWAECDTDEFKRQSRDLAARWGVAEAAVFEQPGVNHFDSLFDWCDPTTRLFAETMRLLRRSTT